MSAILTKTKAKRKGLMINNLNFIIGFEDCSHALWHQQFYPDDLPLDWRLDFYSNQYSVMLFCENTLIGSKFFNLFLEQLEESFLEEFTLLLPFAITKNNSIIGNLSQYQELNILSYKTSSFLSDSEFIQYCHINNTFIFRIDADNELTPVELKMIYDTCVRIVSDCQKNLTDVNEINCYVLFKDSSHIQKNADNFNMLCQLI